MLSPIVSTQKQCAGRIFPSIERSSRVAVTVGEILDFRTSQSSGKHSRAGLFLRGPRSEWKVWGTYEGKKTSAGLVALAEESSQRNGRIQQISIPVATGDTGALRVKPQGSFVRCGFNPLNMSPTEQGPISKSPHTQSGDREPSGTQETASQTNSWVNNSLVTPPATSVC